MGYNSDHNGSLLSWAMSYSFLVYFSFWQSTSSSSFQRMICEYSIFLRPCMIRKQLFLSCCLSILQYYNPAHIQSGHLNKDLSLRFPPPLGTYRSHSLSGGLTGLFCWVCQTSSFLQKMFPLEVLITLIILPFMHVWSCHIVYFKLTCYMSIISQ